MAANFIGELFAIGSVICFVVSNALFRKVDDIVSPSQINAFRTIIGLLTYIIIALIVGQFTTIFQFPPILWMWLALSFIIGQVFGDTAYFKAQEMLGTTIALSISMTFPIFTILISFILGIEIPVYFYGAMVMIIVGVVIIAIGKNKTISFSFGKKETKDEYVTTAEKIGNPKEVSEAIEEAEVEIGNEKINETNTIKEKSKKYLALAIGIALFAAISWSGSIILTEKAINDVSVFLGDTQYSSLLGNVARFPIAAGILSVMSIGDKKAKIKTWGKKTWLFLFSGAIIGTSIGLYFYTEAVFRVNAAFVSIIGSSSPFLSIPISWLINREKVSLLSLLGVFLTVGGVVMIFAFQLALN